MNKSINPHEAVAYGAALQAAILQGVVSDSVSGLLLRDVTPLSLGINVLGEIMSAVIERNTAIPVKKSKIIYTVSDNQTENGIKVYQGERAASRDNHFLGEFLVEDIPSAPRGVEELKVTFDIDENGILIVTALVESTNQQKSLTILSKACLSKKDIERNIKEAEKYRLEDAKTKKSISARNSLESYCYKVKSILNNDDTKANVSEPDRNAIMIKCNEMIDWLDDHQLSDKEEYERRQKELKIISTAIIKTFICSETKKMNTKRSHTEQVFSDIRNNVKKFKN